MASHGNKRPRALRGGDRVTTKDGKQGWIERIIVADGFLLTRPRFVVWMPDGTRERYEMNDLTYTPEVD